MYPILPKVEIYKLYDKIVHDPNGIWTQNMVCLLSGIPRLTMRRMFDAKDIEISPRHQMLMSKALQEIANGDVAVMRTGKKKSVEFRKTPKPRMMRSTKVVMGHDGPQLKIGIINRYLGK